MPGSGPIDPEIVVDAIKLSTTSWSSNHLVVNGANRWLHVDTAANRWTLSTSSDVLIDEDLFNEIKACGQSGPYVLIDRLRYEIAPATIEGSTWAVKLPA